MSKNHLKSPPAPPFSGALLATLQDHLQNDNLTSFATISDFARRTGATLEVVPCGEHWFHTPQQMEFLDGWIQSTRTTLCLTL